MAVDMDAAAKELFEAIAPIMPDDYMVWVDVSGEGILVGTAEKAFVVTRREIEDGVHIAHAKATLAALAAA